MILILWGLGVVVFASFFLIVLRGAPFVPTHQRDIEKLFELHQFKPGEVLVDLGSGDGRVLKAAAEHEIYSVGYELNPFLVLYSRWKLHKYTKQTKVITADFWHSKLPDSTAVVFVFLAGPFMGKLEKKLLRESARLGREITLVSYGMKLPGYKAEQESAGFLVYRIAA